MRQIFLAALFVGLCLPCWADPPEVSQEAQEGRATQLRLEPGGKLRILEEAPRVIELPTVEGNVRQPMATIRSSPWWNSPEVGWGMAPVGGLYWQDPWAPYYGRSSFSSPYGPCW